jgi:hypothetical protein
VKYVVVQSTGFMPYFLCAWNDEQESSHQWACLRSRALVFDGPKARKVANKLNALQPTIKVIVAVLPCP